MIFYFERNWHQPAMNCAMLQILLAFFPAKQSRDRLSTLNDRGPLCWNMEMADESLCLRWKVGANMGQLSVDLTIARTEIEHWDAAGRNVVYAV